jgi:putative ABC transport system substrate-binding protein
MRRREFITLLGGATVWPLAVRAQQLERMRRVGLLMGLAEDDTLARRQMAALREGIEQAGWVEGRNVRIDYRFAPSGAAQADQLATELVALQPDVIVAHSTPNAAALQRATRTIPIVFVMVSDPVGSKFVASLARPGGNLTGFLLIEASIAGKWLSMLKEIEPQLARVTLIANPKTTPYDYFLRAVATKAPSLGIELVPNPVETSADIKRAIETFAGVPNGGLILPPDQTTTYNRELLVELAERYRLPAVYVWRHMVDAGGLMSYGTDNVALFRQTASYVDRILRGAMSAELSVQAPTRYEMVLNLKAAKALGLSVPPGLLVAADDVIE